VKVSVRGRCMVRPTGSHGLARSVAWRDAAEELGMRRLQAHCHFGLGTLYTKIGRCEHARAKLSAAIDLYRAMDMTFWLPQAEAALAEAK
jgi:hypothetical protein